MKEAHEQCARMQQHARIQQPSGALLALTLTIAIALTVALTIALAIALTLTLTLTLIGQASVHREAENFACLVPFTGYLRVGVVRGVPAGQGCPQGGLEVGIFRVRVG